MRKAEAEWVSFGEVVEFSQYGLNEKAASIGTLPMLRMGNIQDGKLDLSDLVYIQADTTDYSEYIIQPGDILFNRTNSKDLVGKSAIVNDKTRATFASYIVRFRLNRSKVDPRFIAAYFNSTAGIAKIRALASPGVSQYNINPTILQDSLDVPILPLPEQKKIAEILSTWDRAIEQSEIIINLKSRKKNHLLEHLFNEIRNKKHLKRLEELAEIIPSNVDKKSYEDETSVRLCNYVDVYKNNKITSNLHFMAATASAIEIQKFTVLKDDVIITKDSETPQDIAIPSFVAEEIDNLVCGYHLTLIRSNPSKILGHYLYYYFLTARSKYYFFKMANGATRFGLSVDSIKECEIPIIEVTYQMKLVEALEVIENEIELLEKYKTKLRKQKQGLMQKLLTGKVRVKV